VLVKIEITHLEDSWEKEWIPESKKTIDKFVCVKDTRSGSTLLIIDQITHDFGRGKSEGVAHVYENAWYSFVGNPRRYFIKCGQVSWKALTTPSQSNRLSPVEV
jgi:hypothetical protein